MGDAKDEPMSDERLAEIRARAAHATPGPWKCWNAFNLNYAMGDRRGQPSRDVAMARLGPDASVGVGVTSTIAHGDIRMLSDDAEFIAHAREDIPALLAEVERMRAREEAVMTFAEFVAGQRPEWIRDDSMLRRRMVEEARALLASQEGHADA